MTNTTSQTPDVANLKHLTWAIGEDEIAELQELGWVVIDRRLDGADMGYPDDGTANVPPLTRAPRLVCPRDARDAHVTK